MHQQINLFQPIFRKEKKFFSFVTSVNIVAFFLVSLVLVYGFSWTKLRAVEGELDTIKHQNVVRLAQLASITKQLNDSTGGDSVEEHIERLRLELKASQFLIEILGEIYSTHRTGFSGYLEGFSRRTVSGMWISEFEMKNGGKSMMINGGAISAELIPQFIDAMSNEPSLLGAHFEMLDMKRKTPNKRWIEFWLSSGDFSEDVFEHLQ